MISNGVINLSPDKPAVFAAAARALRPGGRLALADIVTAEQLPEGVTCDASLWAACIGGAMQRDDYRAAIEAAGFEIESWRENSEYRFVSERADNATSKYGVTSISLLALPAVIDTRLTPACRGRSVAHALISRGAASTVRTTPSARSSARPSNALQSSTMRPSPRRLIVMPHRRTRRPRLDPVSTQRLATRSPSAT